MSVKPQRRRVIMARLTRLEEEDGSFDREFWRRVGPRGRFAAAWEMVVETQKMRGIDVRESRLRRSVQRVERR